MEPPNSSGCYICSEFKKNDSKDCGVYVSGLPPRVKEDEVKAFFSQFDRIEDFYFHDSGQYCIVQFFHRDACDYLLRTPVQMFGRLLKIKPRNSNNNKQTSYNLPSHESICELISHKPSFQLQVEELISILEPEKDSFEKYEHVCTDLKKTLGHISPSYKVMPFGSSVNGLAFKGSDLDVFFGPKTEDSKRSPAQIFEKAKTALFKSENFDHVSPIARARVPIIKFVHKKTGIHCDLSFKNILGVQNSKLVKFFTTVDERVRPFLMIVKYWAQLHSITGKQFSNYALTLLLVNFLQTLKDPILPPIFELQHVKIRPIRVDFWNANFDNDITRLRPISNSQSLNELLSQFFSCLANSNFHDYVLCPVSGGALLKTDFEYPMKLPMGLGMERYVGYCVNSRETLKTDSPLCIQDPLALHFNVSHNLKYSAYLSLRNHCEVAAQICSAPPHMILPHLLSFSSSVPSNIDAYQPSLQSSSKYEVALCFHLEDNAKNFGVSKLLDQIILIFENVLYFQVNCVTKLQKQKLHCQSDRILWLFRDRLWNKFFEKALQVEAEDDDVQVLKIIENTKKNSIVGELSEQDVETDRDKKRKRKDDSEQIAEPSHKRLKVELGAGEGTNASAIATTFHRPIEEEVKLSREMVRSGHAPHARYPILDFECILKKELSVLNVVLKDRHSRMNYLETFCDFLVKTLPCWLKGMDS